LKKTIDDEFEYEHCELGTGAHVFSFVIIADPHVGLESDDYGSQGWDDHFTDEQQEGDDAKRLKQVVSWVRNNKVPFKIEFVIVLGDITHRAERSQFERVHAILSELTENAIPCVAVLGNHDVWPYTKDTEANRPSGLDFYREIFCDINDKNEELLPNWEETEERHFCFDCGDFHFVCADLTSRSHAGAFPPLVSNPKGSTPHATLECNEWFLGHLRSYVESHPSLGRNIVILTHHCLWPCKWGALSIEHPGIPFCLTERSFDRVTSEIASPGPADRILASFSGHHHRKLRITQNKFTRIVVPGLLTPGFWEQLGGWLEGPFIPDIGGKRFTLVKVKE